MYIQIYYIYIYIYIYIYLNVTEKKSLPLVWADIYVMEYSLVVDMDEII